MSNVDVVRESFAATERGDLAALEEMAHPDVELHDWPEGPDPHVYHGVEGILEAREEWLKAWESVRGEPVRYVDAGDRVFVFLRSYGKGKGSSIEVWLDTYGVYTFRGSKVWKVQFFTDRNAALAAAELTEDQIRQEET